jgi:hypothetical protein
MTVHNAREIAVALHAHGEDVQQSVAASLSRLAQEAARDMRRRAPKFQTVLTNSIAVEHVTSLHYRLTVGAAHGAAVEHGRKPGKGLPRFFDPAAAGVVAWLESKAFAGVAKPRKGSKRFAARELELRDRYMGLSRSVKRKGIKAQPFFGPVADELQRTMPQLLAETVQAAVARANAASRASSAGGAA